MAGENATIGDKKKMTGSMKAAIFLLSMGEGRAAEIFKKLNDAEIRQVATTMTQIREILPEDLAAVAEEFIERFEGDTKLMVESGDFLRNVF
jgi:flagellar motor switch protein FliG